MELPCYVIFNIQYSYFKSLKLTFGQSESCKRYQKDSRDREEIKYSQCFIGYLLDNIHVTISRVLYNS